MQKNLISILPLRYQRFEVSGSVKTSQKAVEEFFCPFFSKYAEENFSSEDLKSYFKLTEEELADFIKYLTSEGLIQAYSKSLTLQDWEEEAESKKKEEFAESLNASDDLDFAEDEDEEDEDDDEMSFDID